MRTNPFIINRLIEIAQKGNTTSHHAAAIIAADNVIFAHNYIPEMMLCANKGRSDR